MRSAIQLLLLIGAIAVTLYARQGREQAKNAQVELPQPGPLGEELAGAWETEDPILEKGAELGILLKMTVNTDLQLQRETVVSEGPERVISLDICVYQRTVGISRDGCFSAIPPSRDGVASWDGRRLLLAYPGGRPGVFTIDSLALNVTFNEKDPSWIGTYTRNGISKQIRLDRPGATMKTIPNPFVGTWSFPNKFACVHIAQGTDGSFVAWTIEGIGVKKFESRPLTVAINGNSVRLNDDSQGVVNSDGSSSTFNGTLSADGTQIVRFRTVFEGPRPPNSRPDPVLTKIAGKYCFTNKP